MKKVAIVTDSGANLPKEVVEANANLFVIPLMILMDGVGYQDQVEITAEEIYATIDQKSFTTSLPTMERIITTFEKVKKEGYTDVLVINISSGLSGTFNAFRLALEEVDGLNIVHYDTKTLAVAQGFLVKTALELVKKKTPLDQVVEVLNKERYENSIAMYTISTLKYLRRGGRIGKIEATIGDVLHIKPIITVNNDGVYVTLSKSIGLERTLLKMKQLLIDKFSNKLIDLTVHFGDNLEKAKKLVEGLKDALKIRQVEVTPLTPVLGIHTGPMMFAFIARTAN